MFPPGGSKNCKYSYPVLFYVYGGPYSQMVNEHGQLLVQQFLPNINTHYSVGLGNSGDFTITITYMNIHDS